LAENNENNNLTNENKAAAQVADQEKKDEGKTLAALKDAPKTSADIEKEKKQFNSGNMDVKDNQAENLFTIQNAIINGGVSLGGYTVREVLRNSGKVDKDYDLSEADQFAEFGETVKAGEHFAVAVAPFVGMHQQRCNPRGKLFAQDFRLLNRPFPSKNSSGHNFPFMQSRPTDDLVFFQHVIPLRENTAACQHFCGVFRCEFVEVI
jgi:hypothetical protein